MAVFTMRNFANFDKTLIVTSGDDFAPLVNELKERGKMQIVLSVKRKWCSHLLKEFAAGNIVFLDEVKSKIQQMKKHPADC